MKINRLIEIVTIMLNRKTVTAKELADRFGVSTRTIYRDIDVLSVAGVPVYTEQGKGGGISLLEDYTLSKALLSTSESEALLLALKAMSVTDYPQAGAIADKIGSVFKGSLAHDWIEVSFDGFSSNINEQNKFGKIRDAIIGNHLVSFDYVNAKGEKSNRNAEPVKLMFTINTWYLIAFCLTRGSYRMFRISRIKNVQVTGRNFTKREMPEREIQIPETSFEELVLRCDAKVLSRLYDIFDEQYISCNEDGSYLLKVPILEDEWTYGYILSLGDFAEVLAPIHIREIIKTRAKKILNKYS
jgi:predicted DNA-binding transcriptional regulator YafY